MRRFIFALALFCSGPAFAQPDPDAAQRAEARAILARAVGFDTSVSGAQNPQFAAYLRQLFIDAGIPAADTQIVPLERTAALLVRYRGDGRSSQGNGARPIALLGHMDVVE